MEIVLLVVFPLLAVAALALSRGFSTKRRQPLDWSARGTGTSAARATEWPPIETLVKMVKERADDLEIAVPREAGEWDREQLETWLIDHPADIAAETEDW